MSSADLPRLPSRAAALAAAQAEWQNREVLRSILSLQFTNGAAVRVGAVFERFVLQEVAAEVAKRIENIPRGRRFLVHRRARFLFDAVGEIIRKGSGKAKAAILGEARDLAGTEVTFLRRSGKQVLGAQFSTPAPALVESTMLETPMLGRDFGSWFDDWIGGQTETTVVARVRAGMLAGESTTQIVRALQGTKAAGFSNGVLARARRATTTVVRTTMTHTSNVARDLTFRQNADVVGKVGWLSTLDLRTTPQCIALDGKVWRVDEDHPIPPIHYGCRSTLIPRIGRILGQRAALGGRVDATTKAEDWLRGDRTAAEQDLVLGKTKADAWRAGKLSVRDMVDSTYTRVLTLDELREAGKL